MAQTLNPFGFSGPVLPKELIDREAEREQLIDLAHGPHLVRLEAARRYGKTSLLKSVVSTLGNEGFAAVLVDFEDVLSLGSVISRIERAYAESLRGAIRRHVERLFETWDLGFSLGAAGFSVSLQRRPKLDLDAALRRILSLPEEIHERTGARSYVVFDEVQDLLRVEHADGIVRSVIQHHLDIASYAFAGSAPGLMHRLFDEPDAPFMAQGMPITLGPLPSEPLATYIERRFQQAGKDPGAALTELIDFVRGHPQRAMLLAHHLFARTPNGGEATLDTWIEARDAALEMHTRLLHAHWTSLHLNEQRAIKALALSPSTPGAQEIRTLVGVKRPSIYRALDALEGKGEIIRRPDGNWQIIDPLLELWLRRTKV